MKEEKEILTDDEQHLVRLLECYGGYTQQEMADSLGLEKRTVRRLVRNIRLTGIPIASGDKGYFMAKNKEQLRHTINRLRSQNRKHVDLIFALEDCFKEKKEDTIMSEESDPYTGEILEKMVNHGN